MSEGCGINDDTTIKFPGYCKDPENVVGEESRCEGVIPEGAMKETRSSCCYKGCVLGEHG